MATAFDIAFLRLAISNALADRTTAERCVGLIDERARGGQTVTAHQAVVQLGVVDQRIADKLLDLTKQAERESQSRASGSTQGPTSALARASSSSGPTQVPPSGTGRFAPPPSGTARFQSGSGASLTGLGASPFAGALPMGGAPPAGTTRYVLSPSAKAQLEAAAQRAEPETEAAEPASETLEGFELLAKLGRGASGSAYEARRPADAKPVVLKVLSRRFAKHPLLLERILDDIRRASALVDPRIVRLLDVTRASGRDVVVYEKAEGQTLAALLKSKKKLTIEESAKIVHDVARALKTAEEFGISHGDVRPAKIFVASDGSARLADFGLAAASCLAAGYGQLGVAFGHPEYLAPEVVQERQQRPTARGDVYALGVLFYECVCGRPPFRGKTLKDTLKEQLEAPLPPPPDTIKISTALASVMLKMTAKDPTKRLASAVDVLKVVEEYIRAKRAGLTSDDEMPNAKDLAELAKVEVPISEDDWSAVSTEMSSRSGEWDPKKLEEPAQIGPDEWRPDASGEVEPGSPLAARAKTEDEQRRDREREKEKPEKPEAAKKDEAPTGKSSGYMTALKEAVDAKALDGGSSQENAPAAKKEPKPRGNAGARLTLRGRDQVSRELAQRRVATAIGVVAMLLAVAAVFSILHFKPTEPTAADASHALPSAPPVDPKEVQAREEAERQAALKAGRDALDRLRAEVRQSLDAGRFRMAAERARRVDAEIAAMPGGTGEVEKLFAQVIAAARERIARERAELLAKLKTGDVSGASECARRAAALAPDMLAPDATELAHLVDAFQQRQREPRPPDATAAIDAVGLKTLVASRVQGPVAADAGGVCVVEYVAGEGTLASDLRDSALPRRAKLKPSGSDEGSPLVLDPPHERALLVHELPVVRPIDVRVAFQVRSKTGSTASVAIVAGWTAARPRGLGVAWSLGPVELARGQLVALTEGGTSAVALKPGSTHTIALRTTPPDAAGRAKIALVVDDYQRPPVSCELARLRGQIGVLFDDIDVAITAFRIRAIADVDALERGEKPPR